MSIIPTPENMIPYRAAQWSMVNDQWTELAKAFGQLVVLGFAIADFTPAPYQRPRLGRPSKELSS